MVCYLSSQAPMGGGGWAEKNILHHQGGGDRKIFRVKN